MKYLTTLVLILVCGCSSVGMKSKRAVSPVDGKVSKGVVYSLPKAVVPLQLFDEGGGFRMEAKAPVFVADASATYSLEYQASGFSSDTLTVTVGTNGLLDEIDFKADDRTDDVLVNLAKSLAALKTGFPIAKESAVSPARKILIATFDLEPDDPASADNAAHFFTRAAMLHAEASQMSLCQKEDDDSKAQCKNYEALVESLRYGGVAVSVAAIGSVGKDVDTQPDVKLDGVLIRLPVPYRISFGVAGFETATAVVQIPTSESPISVIDITRASMVEKTTKISFTNGMLTDVNIVKPSEFVETAKLPLTIVNAIISTVGEVFTSRSTLLEKELALIEKQRELKEAKETAKESAVSRPAVLGTASFGVASQATSAGTGDTGTLRNDAGENPQDGAEIDCTGENLSENCF